MLLAHAIDAPRDLMGQHEDGAGAEAHVRSQIIWAAACKVSTHLRATFHQLPRIRPMSTAAGVSATRPHRFVRVEVDCGRQEVLLGHCAEGDMERIRGRAGAGTRAQGAGAGDGAVLAVQ